VFVVVVVVVVYFVIDSDRKLLVTPSYILQGIKIAFPKLRKDEKKDKSKNFPCA
jgi:hypothetical protein